MTSHSELSSLRRMEKVTTALGLLLFINSLQSNEGKDIRNVIPNMNYKPPCEDDAPCYTPSKCSSPCSIQNVGSLSPDSLQLSVTYTSTHSALLTAEWQYEDGRTPIGPVGLRVQQGRNVRCFCVGMTAVKFQTSISGPKDGFISGAAVNPVTVNIYLSNPLKSVKFLTKTIVVGDCWSVMGNRSLEVCGVQIPSPPVNISAVLSVNSSSNESTLRVTWDPPLHHNTPIQYYLIVVMDTGGNPWPVYEAVPQANSTENVFPYHWDGSQQLVVKVRAGVASTNSLCAYCLAKSISGETYYFGVHGTSDVSIVIQDPPTSMQAKPQEKSLEGNIIAVLVMGGLFIVFLLMKFAMCL